MAEMEGLMTGFDTSGTGGVYRQRHQGSIGYGYDTPPDPPECPLCGDSPDGRHGYGVCAESLRQRAARRHRSICVDDEGTLDCVCGKGER